MKVLVTGGAGFIGSTIASACADAGMEPVILDDLSTGLRAFATRFPFYEGDYGDRSLVATVLADHPDLAAVVHCAASIVVPESMADPLRYYENNVAKLPGFVTAILQQSSCRRILFSSTASMYEPDARLVVDEQSPLRPQSPYAASKWMVERILADTAAATDLSVISLRYFNPVGADPKLRSGLQVQNPSHALGKLLQARREGSPFTVTGTDWPTRDGSGLRDYIHVWDLRRGPAALRRRGRRRGRAGLRGGEPRLGHGHDGLRARGRFRRGDGLDAGGADRSPASRRCRRLLRLRGQGGQGAGLAGGTRPRPGDP